MSLAAVVLAAGKGTRMKSDLPKPLHRVCGRSLLGWVVEALDPTRFGAVSLVIGHGGEHVIAAMDDEFPDREFVYAEQHAQRGTGDAAAVGLAELDVQDPSFSDDDHVVVLPGDTPLLTADTVTRMVDQHLQSGVAATVLTARVPDPTGYGRIVRTGDGGVEAIVEHRDASADQLRIDEINGGLYCVRRSLLSPALRLISPDNAQGELYLTDVVSVLVDAGHRVDPFVADAVEVSGVNDRAQLAEAGEALADRILTAHMRNGVSIVQPSSTMIDATAVIEPDVTLHPGTVVEGATTIGAGSVIGPNTHLVDATIGASARVPHAVVDGAVVGDGAHVAPFTHLH